MSLLRRYLPLLTLFLATASFYLYDLNGVGLIGPDEPRYAAIGRAMAQSGDWITPTLWGSPWFEKPPLLYWLTALATALGAGPEISARLPVALLSLAFLLVSYWLLKREFGGPAALMATAALASCAGWVAYSFLCLTDVPLACFFALAVLLLLPLLRAQPVAPHARLILSGACLGMAALAKGLVPFVLILPACWFLRKYWRHWWLAGAACLAVAMPWYLLVYQRNGYPFIEDFFLKQHFQRLYSKSLQHVQPWYFYIPVLLGTLFPWTLLLIWLKTRITWDERRKFLFTLAIFGFVFFSSSINKLPGYLLPLIPLVFALLGSALEGQVHFAISKRLLIPTAILVSLIPLISQALPSMLGAGRITAVNVSHLSATRAFYVIAPVAVILLARRSWAPILLVLCVIGGAFFLKITAFPILDQKVSARSLWKREVQPVSADVCQEWIKGDWVFGLSFYRGQLLQPCDVQAAPWHLLPRPRTLPVLVKK